MYTQLHEVPGLASQVVTHIAAGGEHTLVLCASGEVFGFGSDRYQQLGLGAWQNKNPTARHSPTYMSGYVSALLRFAVLVFISLPLNIRFYRSDAFLLPPPLSRLLCTSPHLGTKSQTPLGHKGSA